MTSPLRTRAPPRWFPSCATFSRESAKRKTRANARRQRRKIHIKREKSKTESRANDARSVEYVCSLPASFSHPPPSPPRSPFHLSLALLFFPLRFPARFLYPFSLSFPLSSSHVPSFALPLFPSFSEKKRCHTHARDARTYLTAYTNPGCLNSLANYFHSVSLFPCISRYQSVCALRRRY